MVKAIQALIKNQTRRTKGLKMVNENPDQWKFVSLGPNPEKENDTSLYAYFKTGLDTWTYAKAEANVGDIFWVRETWQQECYEGDYPEGKAYIATKKYVYRADEYELPKESKAFGKWKPSIFMPKEACRLFLEVTNVRVERLHDISEEDAKAEGIKIYSGFEQFENYNKIGYRFLNSAIDSFFSLWRSINGKESLDANPWVFAYSFEQIEKPDNF